MGVEGPLNKSKGDYVRASAFLNCRCSFLLGSLLPMTTFASFLHRPPVAKRPVAPFTAPVLLSPVRTPGNTERHPWVSLHFLRCMRRGRSCRTLAERRVEYPWVRTSVGSATGEGLDGVWRTGMHWKRGDHLPFQVLDASAIEGIRGSAGES